MRTHSTLTRVAVVLTLSAVGLTVAGCGGNSSGHDVSSASSSSKPISSSDDFNQADVDFATDMIPHHAQAIQMVTLTDGRTLDPAVERLATAIKNEQTPEISSMSGWLQKWGQPVPPTDSSSMGGMDMSSGMPGMMSEEDMQSLADASDADFQDLWLRMMKQHHEGAVEMAQSEEKNGKAPDAIALATSVITAQKAEIEQIDRLLGK